MEEEENKHTENKHWVKGNLYDVKNLTNFNIV